MQSFLSLLGRKGPLLLFAGSLVGLLCPAMAGMARPAMASAVFVFTLAAFLKATRASLVEELTRPRRLVAVLVWTTVGVPFVAWGFASHVGLPAGAALGMAICMVAPPVGSAGAMAAMLRLNVALAVVGTVAASALAPLFMPVALAASGTAGWQIDSLALFQRTATLIGGAAVVAALLRRFACEWIDGHPEALTGASVLGLIVVALGVMHGMQPLFVEHAGKVGETLLIAFAANIGLQLLGAALFSTLGWRDAATVGLLSGNRNVTLVAAVLAPWLSDMPEVRLYIAASVFPIFMLPLLLSKIGWWLAPRLSSPALDAIRRLAIASR